MFVLGSQRFFFFFYLAKSQWTNSWCVVCLLRICDFVLQAFFVCVFLDIGGGGGVSVVYWLWVWTAQLGFDFGGGSGC